MYSYGLGGGQPTKHNLLWQDRRDRNVPTQPQQNDNWWNKVKRSVSATEPPQLIPSKVFFRDKGMLGGKGVLNVPERKQEPQLFSLNNVEEGPTRPQLNLGDTSGNPINKIFLYEYFERVAMGILIQRSSVVSNTTT